MTSGNQVNGSVAKDGRLTSGWQPGITNVIGTATCAVVTGPCSPQTWKALPLMAAFTHYWNPSLRSNFAES